MDADDKLLLRIVAVVMALAAAGWGYWVWWQAASSDDGGPPMGALCSATPSIALLIAAGVVWSRTNRREPPSV